MNPDDLIGLYREMSELTKPECGKCRNPYSCCSPEYCEMAIHHAQTHWDVALTPTGHAKLPLLDPATNQCTAAPHLRPCCTMHTCDVNSFGCHRSDPDWTRRYFELRDRIEYLEWCNG